MGRHQPAGVSTLAIFVRLKTTASKLHTGDLTLKPKSAEHTLGYLMPVGRDDEPSFVP